MENLYVVLQKLNPAIRVCFLRIILFSSALKVAGLNISMTDFILSHLICFMVEFNFMYVIIIFNRYIYCKMKIKNLIKVTYHSFPSVMTDLYTFV